MYGPRFFVGYTFLAACKKKKKQKERETDRWLDRQKYTFHRTTTLHSGS